MSRLSIVIPFLGNRDLLENSLASVLQNRPAETEIVVALGQSYDDPYQLDQEVRFIAAQGTGLADVLNQGIEACRAPIIHLLACGASVSEHWADQALRHFRDPRVASVVPLIVDAEAPDRVLAAGLEYHIGGVCRERGCGRLASSISELGGEPIGPSGRAGFYRRSALGDSGATLEPSLGSHLIAADLALRLAEAGYTTICEPASLVLQPRETLQTPSGFDQARRAERLFWRHAASRGWGRSLVSHGWSVAGEFARSLPRLRAIAQIAGRFLAICERGYELRRKRLSALPSADREGAHDFDRQLGESAARRLDRPHFQLDVPAKGAPSNAPRPAGYTTRVSP